MYSTKSVSIHGLRYKIGECVVVLKYNDGIPEVGRLHNILIHNHTKYFLFEKSRENLGRRVH